MAKTPTWHVRLRTISHRITWVLGTRFPEAIPLVFVVGYPKSGTTWVCQLAADLLELFFPRYSLLPIGCPAVVHGHEVVRKGYPKCIYSVRDGRDVMASLYFFLSRHLPDGPLSGLSPRDRRLFPGMKDKNDTKRNFLPFLEGQLKSPHASPKPWGAHVRSFFEARNPNTVMIRYEDLLSDGAATLVRELGVIAGRPIDEGRARASMEKYSFARQAGRKKGAEDRSSFLRKGQAGDWMNHFTPEAAAFFDRHFGEELVRTGYENDRGWVERFAKRCAAGAGASEGAPAA